MCTQVCVPPWGDGGFSKTLSALRERGSPSYYVCFMRRSIQHLSRSLLRKAPIKRRIRARTLPDTPNLSSYPLAVPLPYACITPCRDPTPHAWPTSWHFSQSACQPFWHFSQSYSSAPPLRAMPRHLTHGTSLKGLHVSWCRRIPARPDHRRAVNPQDRLQFGQKCAAKGRATHGSTG
jgi:hypothetical protein